jgi:hypothetical protein
MKPLMPPKNDSNVESPYAINTRRSELFGYVLLAGLVVEWAFAFILKKPLWETISAAVSDSLIVAGVWGEIHFGKKARVAGDAAVADADARVAEALQKAAEAHERAAAVEKLTAWRHISPEQTEQLTTALRGMGLPIRLMIEYQQGDPEAFSYSWEVAKIFADAGGAGVRHNTNFFLGPAFFGLYLATAPEVPAMPILTAFENAGVQVSAFNIDISRKHIPEGQERPTVYVFVASKPPPMIVFPKLGSIVTTSNMAGAADANQRAAQQEADAARLLEERRLTANQRWRLERVERAVLPRAPYIDFERLGQELRASPFAPVSFAVVDEQEPRSLGTALMQSFATAEMVGGYAILPDTGKWRGVQVIAVNSEGDQLSDFLWQRFQIGGTTLGLGPAPFAERFPELAGLSAAMNCIVIGENDAASRPGDGQPGEGIDEHGGPDPAPHWPWSHSYINALT